MADEPKVPGNFSALYDAGLRSRRGLTAARRTPGDVRLSNTIDDLQVDYDEATQMPVRVTSRSSARGLARTTAAEPERTASRRRSSSVSRSRRPRNCRRRIRFSSVR